MVGSFLGGFFLGADAFLEALQFGFRGCLPLCRGGFGAEMELVGRSQVEIEISRECLHFLCCSTRFAFNASGEDGDAPFGL